LSSDEVKDLIKPADKTLDLVLEWLQDSGIEAAKLQYSPAKDWINIALPVNQVEALLDTKFSVFEHEDGGYIVRTPSWSLPKHLHEHIETIQPTNSFFRATAQKKTLRPVENIARPHYVPFHPNPHHQPGSAQTVAEVCNVTNVTPLCLRTLYGTLDYVPKVPGKNRIGIANYLGEANNRSDVSLFLQQFRPEAVSAASTFKVNIIADGDDQQTPNTPEQLKAGKDLEGNLDAETIIAIDYPTPLITYNTGGSPPFVPDFATPTDTNEPYLVWIQYMLSQDSLPQVISTSYGDDEQTVPPSYAKTVCKGFAQLGARGISLLFSSGDGGVGGDGECFSNDGKNTTMFLPEFPAACPFVTAVGETKNFSPEIAAKDTNGFTSGGGFSNYFARPSYQDKVVSAYIKALNSSFAYPGLYNKSGRAYPDIAAQGQRYAVIWNGTLVHLDGTSASSPCAASIISLVNDALIAKGKSPLGFLNPWIYAKGFKAFTDVTEGLTQGCDTAGFPAAPGWDPVTGFGTPVRIPYRQLLEKMQADNSFSTFLNSGS
jgi:tripeptidyl-peptidase-1